MDADSLREEVFHLLKKNILAFSLLCFGVVLLIYGLISSVKTKDSSRLEFIPAAQNSALASTTPSSKIIVDIEGAVMKPGAYEITSGSRIKDLLVLSGGLSANADRIYFEKNINLASKLSDGQKVYIARQGEAVEASQNSLITNFAQISIGINTASLKDLDSLPGIGMVTAQKIVDGRPYSDISELLSKKIVTSKVFDQIKEKISAN